MTIQEIIAKQNATAPRRKPRDEEHQIQCACVKWFNLQYPEYRGLLFAVPNGGARSKATAGKLKAEGVVAGVADLILLIPMVIRTNLGKRIWHGLCIELKTPQGRQSKEQRQWQHKVEGMGYEYTICRSFDDFKYKLEEWWMRDEYRTWENEDLMR